MLVSSSWIIPKNALKFSHSKRYEKIDLELAAMDCHHRISLSPLAPLSAKGHVNASPKDDESFRILGHAE